MVPVYGSFRHFPSAGARCGVCLVLPWLERHASYAFRYALVGAKRQFHDVARGTQTFLSGTFLLNLYKFSRECHIEKYYL